MRVEYVPVLHLQRTLHDLPPGRERFDRYIGMIRTSDLSDIELIPLVVANPMAKDHVAILLDQLLAFDADGIAAKTTDDLNRQFSNVECYCRASLVVIDDLHGGWTNRAAVDHNLRRIDHPSARRFWSIGAIWSSQETRKELVVKAITTALLRTAFVAVHGPASTLRDVLIQESFVLSFSDNSIPDVPEDDLDYTQGLLNRDLESTDLRTHIELLMGDPFAATLGLSARGLPAWAGLAWARSRGRIVRGSTSADAPELLAGWHHEVDI